jgi:hypothetical protein
MPTAARPNPQARPGFSTRSRGRSIGPSLLLVAGSGIPRYPGNRLPSAACAARAKYSSEPRFTGPRLPLVPVPRGGATGAQFQAGPFGVTGPAPASECVLSSSQPGVCVLGVSGQGRWASALPPRCRRCPAGSLSECPKLLTDRMLRPFLPWSPLPFCWQNVATAGPVSGLLPDLARAGHRAGGPRGNPDLQPGSPRLNQAVAGVQEVLRAFALVSAAC